MKLRVTERLYTCREKNINDVFTSWRKSCFRALWICSKRCSQVSSKLVRRARESIPFLADSVLHCCIFFPVANNAFCDIFLRLGSLKCIHRRISWVEGMWISPATEGDLEMLMNCRSWSCVSITSMTFPAKTTLLKHKIQPSLYNYPNTNPLFPDILPFAGDFRIP